MTTIHERHSRHRALFQKGDNSANFTIPFLLGRGRAGVRWEGYTGFILSKLSRLASAMVQYILLSFRFGGFVTSNTVSGDQRRLYNDYPMCSKRHK